MSNPSVYSPDFASPLVNSLLNFRHYRYLSYRTLSYFSLFLLHSKAKLELRFTGAYLRNRNKHKMQTKFYLVNVQIHHKNVIYLAVVVTLRLGKSREINLYSTEHNLLNSLLCFLTLC